jgi:hypothetical protein
MGVLWARRRLYNLPMISIRVRMLCLPRLGALPRPPAGASPGASRASSRRHAASLPGTGASWSAPDMRPTSPPDAIMSWVQSTRISKAWRPLGCQADGGKNGRMHCIARGMQACMGGGDWRRVPAPCRGAAVGGERRARYNRCDCGQRLLIKLQMLMGQGILSGCSTVKHSGVQPQRGRGRAAPPGARRAPRKRLQPVARW